MRFVKPDRQVNKFLKDCHFCCHLRFFPLTRPPAGQVVANIALYAGSAVVSGHEVTAEAATRYWLADKDTKVAVSTLNMAKLNHSTATTVCVCVCVSKMGSNVFEKYLNCFIYKFFNIAFINTIFSQHI